MAFLRQRGLHVYPYLDELLICAHSFRRLGTEVTIQCLRDHGFLFSLQKSQLIPAQHMQHLGMILDTRLMSLFLTHEQIVKTKQLALAVIIKTHSRLMTLTKLLGLLVASMDALQWGCMHT